MRSNISPSSAQGKKVPLLLGVVLACAAGIAFFSILCSPASAFAKGALTPQQEEAILSDIEEENIKVPEPESLGESLLPQGTEEGYGTSGGNMNVEETAEALNQGEKGSLTDEGATLEEAQKAAEAQGNDDDYAREKKVKDDLIAQGATPESAQEAIDAAINTGDFSKLNKLNRLLEKKNMKKGRS